MDQGTGVEIEYTMVPHSLYGISITHGLDRMDVKLRKAEDCPEFQEITTWQSSWVVGLYWCGPQNDELFMYASSSTQ